MQMMAGHIPEPATPTVAAPAPMNLAAESMSFVTDVVWNDRTADSWAGATGTICFCVGTAARGRSIAVLLKTCKQLLHKFSYTTATSTSLIMRLEIRKTSNSVL